MNTLENIQSMKSERIKTTQEAINQYPHLKDKILDLYDLMEDEIDSGGSKHEEYQRFKEDLKELIEE